MADDLVTLASVKSFLGEETAYSDTQLQDFISAASGWIRHFIDPVEYTVYTAELYDGSGQPVMNLRHWPLKEPREEGDVFTVLIDGVDVSSYVKWYWRTGEIRYARGTSPAWGDGWFPRAHSDWGWPHGYQNVSVSYVAGYAAIAPERIQAACRMIVKHWAGSSFLARSVFYEGGGGAGPERDIPKQAKGLLASFPSYKGPTP